MLFELSLSDRPQNIATLWDISPGCQDQYHIKPMNKFWSIRTHKYMECNKFPAEKILEELYKRYNEDYQTMGLHFLTFFSFLLLPDAHIDLSMESLFIKQICPLKQKRQKDSTPKEYKQHVAEQFQG
ncbi:uncharacterized protein LOC105749663 isoform X2 [Sarcophilus harrisii]|uniref:uncharacterized protein LOC105749663 isoform X2 n=1 Tax=Sarcophilus harrisii TaxID=9305 RepID=UPI001301EEA2|nr:uncharacterized protein LOC105749663 isoform X2 [Sarcophilus harrisii]